VTATRSLKALACLLALAFAAPTPASTFVTRARVGEAAAQGPRPSPPAAPAAPVGTPETQVPAGQVGARERQPASAADESFDLDIPLRRIVEEDFQAATEVEAGGDSVGLRLRVGAHVRGQRAELLLRNVRGSVRFRASLGVVLRLLEGRRATTGAPAGPSP